MEQLNNLNILFEGKSVLFDVISSTPGCSLAYFFNGPNFTILEKIQKKEQSYRIGFLSL